MYRHRPMEDLIAAIRRLDELDSVKQLLLQLPRETLEHQEESYDLLHHAIEVNYPEVVLFSFLRGLFLEPHQPKSIPYLHLACWLGRTSVVHILLEHRPGDFRLRISTEVFIVIENVGSRPEPESGNHMLSPLLEELNVESTIHGQDILMSMSPKCNFASLTTTSDSPNLYHPVDVAATAGHVSCVQALLASQASKCTLSSLVERAVEVNSPGALKLLLVNHHSHQDKNKAFREALRRKLHDCVQLLLEYGAQAETAFNKLNPFHVLYMYSSAYQVQGQQLCNKGLDDTTAVLLQHGYSPDAREPFGSFPLYSLIHALVQEKDYRPASIPEYHINALRHLLSSGADPNFDELKYAKERDKNYYYNTAVGRDLFTSGLNAFFVSLQASDTWRPHVTEYLEECVMSMLDHGADAGYVDCHGQTPLHDLMKVIAMQHAMGHMHCNVRKMCRMLLCHGANPNVQSGSGYFPVHEYFSILCELMGGLIAFERWKVANNTEQVIHMLYFMDHDKALKVYNQVIECMVKAKEDGMTDEVIHFFAKQMADVIQAPKSLHDLCKLCIWQSVDRKKANLDHLNMPKSLVRAVHEMFQ